MQWTPRRETPKIAQVNRPRKKKAHPTGKQSTPVTAKGNGTGLAFPPAVVLEHGRASNLQYLKPA